MNTYLIEHKFNVLPDDLKKEVLNFIDFLIAKRKLEKSLTPFNFSWEGGLADYNEEYSSVDLQHQSMGWR